MARNVKTSTRVKNNGATVMYGGTTSTAVTKVLGIETAGYRPRKFDNPPGRPHTSTEIGNGTFTRSVWKPYSAGQYNRMGTGKYVMMKYCSELAGVSNVLLNYAAVAPYVRYIHKSERLRTTMLTGWSWAKASGNNAHGDPKNITVYTATESDRNSLLYGPDTNGYDGLDSAARPTKAIPGELAVMYTGKTPTMVDYTART